MGTLTVPSRLFNFAATHTSANFNQTAKNNGDVLYNVRYTSPDLCKKSAQIVRKKIFKNNRK